MKDILNKVNEMDWGNLKIIIMNIMDHFDRI